MRGENRNRDHSLCTFAYMGIREDIGRRIAAEREALGLSQAALARLAGMNKAGTRISNYEMGSREPDAQTMVALAKALNTTPEYLMFGVRGSAAVVTLSSQKAESFFSRDIQEALARMTPTELRKLENLVRVHVDLPPVVDSANVAAG